MDVNARAGASSFGHDHSDGNRVHDDQRLDRELCGTPHRGGGRKGDDGILRGKGLEIVDDAGHVRASIQLLRADDGSDSGVILRLIDAHGRPTVKVDAGERGAVLSLCGPSDPGCAVLSVEDREPHLRFIAKDGHEQVLAP